MNLMSAIHGKDPAKNFCKRRKVKITFGTDGLPEHQEIGKFGLTTSDLIVFDQNCQPHLVEGVCEMFEVTMVRHDVDL